jgi:2-polyprenyl-6-hydroxyphenyl methylase/3-demethylubiquinone-9 3-methyltransferase
MQVKNNRTTIDPEEIARFSAVADEWWDEHGKFAPLHRINPLRIKWIRERSASIGPTLLDIGCGGGLVAEPMARLGMQVTAIDASERNIKVATLHAEKMGLDIDYRCTSAEEMNEQFDVVLALEIIEHVVDIPAFVAATCKLLKPGGRIFYSTINRTAKSYALAIVGAEYVLRWVPKGTHTWSKFVKPHELVRELEKNGIVVDDMRGMVMNPLTFKWRWDENDLSVNYALCGVKR